MTGRQLHTSPANVTALQACSNEALRDSVTPEALELCRKWKWIEPDSWTLTAEGRKLMTKLKIE